MGRAIDEAAIRERAYLIWVREGRPHGADVDHWHRATLELLAEDRVGAPGRPRAPVKPKPPPAGGRGPKRATRKKG